MRRIKTFVMFMLMLSLFSCTDINKQLEEMIPADSRGVVRIDVKSVIEKGQLVEVICMMNLDLMYYFGRVIGFESGQLILDVSRDYNKEVVYINTRDIRDLEVYTGEFKLYNHNEDDVEFDYPNNSCCKFTFSDD